MSRSNERRAGLAPGNRVLDVAIGTGLVARAARDILGDSGHITGLDLSMGMLAEARKKLPITLVQSAAERLPLVGSGFTSPRQDATHRVFSEYVATKPRH